MWPSWDLVFTVGVAVACEAGTCLCLQNGAVGRCRNVPRWSRPSISGPSSLGTERWHIRDRLPLAHLRRQFFPVFQDNCSAHPLSAGDPSAVFGALPSASLQPQGLGGGLEEHISKYGSLEWVWGLPSHFPSHALLTLCKTGGRCQVLGLPAAFL